MSDEPEPAGFEISEITHDLRYPNEVSAIVTIHGGEYGVNNSGKVCVTAILPHNPDQSLSSYEEAFRIETVRRLREAAVFLEGTTYPEAIAREKASEVYNQQQIDQALSEIALDSTAETDRD